MTAVESLPTDEPDDEPGEPGDEEPTEDESTDHTVGAWEAAFVSWRVAVPVIVGNAAVQASTVLADPVPETGVGFVALVLGSVASLLVAVWFTVGAAQAAVAGRAREGWRTAIRRPLVMVWALGLGIVAVAASLLAVWLLPVVLALGAFLLPPPGDRSRPVAALVIIRRSPFRALLLVIIALVVAGLSAMVALLFGLFVTGALSAALLWLWLGAVSTVLLGRYAVLARRADLRA